IAQRETEALAPVLLDIRDKTGAALIVIEHDMPLITTISDELVALELGSVVARGEPQAVVTDPRVVEGYLGTSEAAIHRSGARGVDGNESVAAIKILIYGSVTKATLVISEAANQTTAVSVPKLQVCKTDGAWTVTGNPGPYKDAPAPNCAAAAAPLTRDDKGA